jgi:hypothetical protein
MPFTNPENNRFPFHPARAALAQHFDPNGAFLPQPRGLGGPCTRHGTS